MIVIIFLFLLLFLFLFEDISTNVIMNVAMMVIWNILYVCLRFFHLLIRIYTSFVLLCWVLFLQSTMRKIALFNIKIRLGSPH